MTPGLNRGRLYALLAAAYTPGDADDPLLGYRLAAAAEHARHEATIKKAAMRAFTQWATLCRSAVLHGRGLTAAPTDHPDDQPEQPGEPTGQAPAAGEATAPAAGAAAAGEAAATAADAAALAAIVDPHAVAMLGPAWDGIAQATIVPAIDQVLGEVFATHLADTGVVSPRAWSENYLASVSNRLAGIPDQTFNRVRGTLQAGHDAGESIPELRDRILDTLAPPAETASNYWQQRATLIARTETTGAMAAGHLEARKAVMAAAATAEGTSPHSAEALGDKVWLATLDDRTRPHHVELDGQRVPLGEKFTVGEAHLDHPGDPEGGPGEVCNCRCTLLFLAHDQELPTVGKRQMGQDTTPDSSGLSTATEGAGRDTPVGGGAPVQPAPQPAPPAVTAAPTNPTQDDPAGAPSTTPTPEGHPMPRTWRSAPYLAPFGQPTGDGRIFAVGSLTARALPLPLLYQDSSAPGHDQSVVVGRITDVQFTDQGIAAQGDYLDDPSVADVVARAIALVEAGLGTVSVDLAAVTGELVDPTGAAVSMEDIFDAWDRGEDPTVLEQVTSGQLIACTQVATPAFEGARIEMADSGPADPAAPAPGEPVAAALDGAAVFSAVDSAGQPLAAGDVVQVVVDANGQPIDPAAGAGEQEAATPPPAAPGAPSAKPEDKTPGGEKAPAEGTKTVKGRVTDLDTKAEKVTVQPEDATADPIVCDPQYVTKVDGGDAPANPAAPAGAPATPAPAHSAASLPKREGGATQQYDMAEVIGGTGDDAAAPADPATDPAAGEPDEVAPVKGAGDVALLEAVAPHYDAAAQLVRDAFASISDDRVKALAADLVEDAAAWRALADYGLTPDDDEDGGLVAAAAGQGIGPLNPPAEWFANPNLAGPTAITVTDDGRVYGHVAVWGTCHVGFSQTCVTPPTSPSSYAYFHTGEVVCADGARVAVGNLTLGGRHADVKLAYRSAIEHYDVQGAGVAVVRIYEDEHGIAMAGALTAGATQEQVYDMRRSPVSGDWRRVGGNLELIGVLSVNSPGFPTPRFATDTAGRTALTAAPSVRPEGAPLRTRGEGLSPARLSAAIQAQISKEVAAELGRRRAEEQTQAAARARSERLRVATLAVKGDPRTRMAALAVSVDGGRSQARRDKLAALAGAVRG